jgi:acetylornithine deacetylase/succinyl-diaminopimelate desuccinylase-like protein
VPEDNLEDIVKAITHLCESREITLSIIAAEPGVACDENNPYLLALIDSIEQATGEKPELGKKLAGTSARFAPHGQGIVWGQSGIGPHSANERHYIPSIMPYYQSLNVFGEQLSLIEAPGESRQTQRP